MKLSKLDSKLHYNVKIKCDKKTMDKIVELLNDSSVLYKETELGINFKVLPSDYSHILKIYDKFDMVYEVCAKDKDILVLSSDKILYSVLSHNWNTTETKDGVLKISFLNTIGPVNNFRSVHDEIKSYFENKEEAKTKEIPVEDFKVIAVGKYLAIIGSENVLSAAEGTFTNTARLTEMVMIPFGIIPEGYPTLVKERIKAYFNWK
jgi:hypothetical protein